MNNEEREPVFRPGMDQDEQEKTLEQLINEFRETATEQEYPNYMQDHSNELIRETVDRIIENKLQNAKKESIRISREIKETIGLENRDLIERTIGWDTFIKSGPIKMIDLNHYALVGTNTDIVGNTTDTIELCKVFNQIFNKTNNEVLGLREIIRDLNKDKITDEVYNDYYDKYELIHDSYNEFLKSNKIELEGRDIRLAEEIILNIDSFVVKEDGLLVGKISGEDIEIGMDNQLYSAMLNAITDFQTSDLLINKYNTFNKVIYEDSERLKNQPITKKDGKPIKVSGEDVDNLKSKETVEPLGEIDFEDEDKDKKNSHEDEHDKDKENYDQKRLKINEESKENHTKPKDRKEQLYNLKVHEKEDGNWSLSRGIYHAGANVIGGVGYRITYIASSTKEKLKNFAISRGFYGFGKKVIKLFDGSGKDKKTEPKKLENKKTEPKKTKDENLEPKKAEEKNLDPKKTKDEKPEPKKSEDKHTNNLINENDSDSKKYRTLLDNVCERLEKTETNKDELKKALAEYGISEESYKESSSRRQQQRITQYRNEKYTNQFTQDLHEKVQSAIAKNKYEDDMRLKKEMEKLDQMHQELAAIKETKLTPSPYLTDELNKLYEVSNLQTEAPTQPNTNTLPDNFNDELNQLFNSTVEEKGKSK